uniref:Uncharacterized protein n=1 Tax=Peromyscus maniculatus bairdii TaxID=230844 RepID=A0A8C8UKS0_PERMB
MIHRCGGWSMRCRFRVTVRIRGRAGRPPRVKAFVVQFPRSSRPRAASRERAVVAVLLMLVRSQPTGPQLHPDQVGNGWPPKPRARGAAVPLRRGPPHSPPRSCGKT